jgi:hypothetical protein
MTAYVLVQTATQDGRIANLLRRLPGIVFAEDVRGPYDAVALVRSDVGFEAIVDRVRGLPGVTTHSRRCWCMDPSVSSAIPRPDRQIQDRSNRKLVIGSSPAMRSLLGVLKCFLERHERLVDR